MTATTPDRDAQMLAELAELDLSAVRHVHAQLMAASEAGEVADLSRSYQRASRCLRQTLALKAKLAQDAVVHRIRTTPSPGTDWAAMQRDLIHCDELGVFLGKRPPHGEKVGGGRRRGAEAVDDGVLRQLRLQRQGLTHAAGRALVGPAEIGDLARLCGGEKLGVDVPGRAEIHLSQLGQHVGASIIGSRGHGLEWNTEVRQDRT